MEATWKAGRIFRGDFYYELQAALSPHMASCTELMAAMSTIYPMIENEAERLVAEKR